MQKNIGTEIFCYSTLEIGMMMLWGIVFPSLLYLDIHNYCKF